VVGEDATGDVVLGICVPGNPVLEARVDGFKEALGELAPNLTVKGAFDVTADPARNLSTWRQLIQTNPGAKAFAGFCAFDLTNLIKIKEQDANAPYEVFGTDLEPDTLRGIKEGVASATYGQKPWLQGYIGVKLLSAQLTGGEELHGWIDVGVEEVTEENIDAIMKREQDIGRGDAAAAKSFYQAEIDEILSDPQAMLKPLSEISK
jgi:ribose transport system substrate-binding protein